MLHGVFIVAAVGFAISLYGLWVERKKQENLTYKPICDISDKVSCSKTFLSPWGKLFGISNVYLGLLAYLVIMVLAVLGLQKLILYIAVALVLFSAFLAYILFVKIKAICLICISVYIVNLALLICAFIGI